MSPLPILRMGRKEGEGGHHQENRRNRRGRSRRNPTGPPVPHVEATAVPVPLCPATEQPGRVAAAGPDRVSGSPTARPGVGGNVQPKGTPPTARHPDHHKSIIGTVHCPLGKPFTLYIPNNKLFMGLKNN